MYAIADRLAVQDVMIAYMASVDTRDYARFLACFVADVAIEGFTDRLLVGHRAVRDFCEPALAQFRATQHLIAPSGITLAGDTAHARTDVQASHYFADSETRTLTLWGTYESDFVRTDAGWKISRHRLITKSVRETP